MTERFGHLITDENSKWWALAVVAVLGPSLGIVVAVLGIASWPAYARIARSGRLEQHVAGTHSERRCAS